MEIEKILNDSYLIKNFLNGFMLKDIIEKLEKEVLWNKFEINGKELCRTGSFQGISNEFGDKPYIRCPSIDIVENITPIINQIVELIPITLKDNFNFSFEKPNIIKIQKYDDGRSFITDHTDKIIDLEENSPIFNLRLGATRTFVLTNKKTKDKYLIKMPHNSLFIIGPDTNKNYLHGVPKETHISEPSYSLVFRKSVTFKDSEKGYLYGPRSIIKEKLKDIEENIKKSLSKEESLKELIKLFHIENNDPVGLELYEDYINKTCY